MIYAHQKQAIFIKGLLIFTLGNQATNNIYGML